MPDQLGPLVLTAAAKIRLLDRLLSGGSLALSAGLYQNPAVLDQATTLSQLGPATFSGYTGLQGTGPWSAAVLLGERAIAHSAPLSWSHDGGICANWIYGYYAVDESGDLLWAAPRAEGAVQVSVAGRTVTVTPRFSLRSEFGA